MGKRLPKKQLLAEIQLERGQLISLIAQVRKRQFNVPGLNSADWSIKDVLTHLVDWETRVLGWYESGKRGDPVELPGDGFKWNQTRELNAMIQKKHSRKSITRVLKELDEVHVKTLALIDSLSNQELTSIGHFEWTGKSWTLSDYLRSSTASHYRWARIKIRKWLATLD